MSAPVKAELQVLDRQGTATETIPVQFNPASMSMQMSNSIDGAQSRGRQRQQYNGSASTTLSLDLEFDTADEGTQANPVDVRDKTAAVRQFVLPGGTESKTAPPRVRLRWGTFELTGVMDSLTEELSFFSSDGVPLRSKLSVQIKEQDSRFEALDGGVGSNGSNDAPAAGEGGQASGAIDRIADALDGETPADFLARNGLAPDAWRALGSALGALSAGVELEAGVSIGFSAELSVGAGIGVSAGFRAGVDASSEIALGLRAGAGARGSATAGLGQGLALAAAGGLSSAAETAKSTEAEAASQAARRSFGAPAHLPVAVSARADGSSIGTDRAPLNTRGTALPNTPAPPAPGPPVADVRATTFGHGVPLHPRRLSAGADPSSVPVGARAVHDPWSVAPSAAQRHADRVQGARTPKCGCHDCGSRP